VSLIEGSSFLSNKQDGSLDSMDKLIIGVSMGDKEIEGEDDRQGISKESITDLDFNEIHKHYERLIGRKELLGEEEDEEDEENSRVLPDEDEWQFKESEKRGSSSLSPKKPTEPNGYNDAIKQHLLRIQHKV
jgi:hypothetical protein